MKLGVVVDGSDTFVAELLDDWRAHYEVEVFSHCDIKVPVIDQQVKWYRLKRALSAFLRRNDVVFFEWAGLLFMYATNFANHLPNRARIMTRLHSYELYEYAPHIHWETVERVIFVSNAMQRRFAALYPAVADRTSVVYHGKSLDKFYASRHSFSGVVGMLCNLIPVKRVYEVILAVYEANRSGMDLTLRLGGSPGQGVENLRYYAAMQRLVAELHLADRIIFDGHIENPARFLGEIDIFISNSYWEGQQNALLEAMASECYCLAHSWDGVNEILPAEYVFVTDVELREKLLAYSALSESDRQAHRARMRAIINERFRFQDTSAALRAVIEGTAGEQRKQHL